MEPFVVIAKVPFKYTRLIDASGNYHKSIPMWEAKKMAEDTNLQLVCFSIPEGNQMALCKVINYGKWKYEQEKNKKKIAKEQKKNVKEIRFSPNISDNDILHKMRQINDFLDRGDDVIVHMRAEGRDLGHMDLVNEKMNTILSHCKNGKIVSRKDFDGNIYVKLTK